MDDDANNQPIDLTPSALGWLVPFADLPTAAVVDFEQARPVTEAATRAGWGGDRAEAREP